MYSRVCSVILLGLFISTNAIAETHNIKAGQVYIGKETLNEHATGDICYVTILDAEPIPEKGLYCNRMTFQYNSVRTDIPKEELKVDSRITNYHRVEFPTVRTCALNVDGTSSGPEIYGEDTSILYSQIFGGSHTKGSTRFDYFLTLDPKFKMATRARVHILEIFSERDVDCINLELM